MTSLAGSSSSATDHGCEVCERVAQYICSATTREIDLGTWAEYKARNKCRTCLTVVWIFSNWLGGTTLQNGSTLHLYYDSSLAGYRIITYGGSSQSLSLFPSINIMDKSLSYEWSTEPQETSVLYHRSVDPESIDLARLAAWVRYCDENHESHCHGENLAVFAAVPKAPRLRLIDLHNDCLIETDGNMQYVCLSYVWGHRANPFTLTRDNRDQLHVAGSFAGPEIKDTIPDTIKDAIHVTRGIGVRYLWVDRLCITQDDREEMHAQLQCMHAIYANAYVTIVAADGADAETGLGRVNGGFVSTEPWQQILLKFGNEVVVQAFYPHENLKKPLPWHTRAWTFQERYISRRCLLFLHDTVSWECCKSKFWECFHEACNHYPMTRDFQAFPSQAFQPWPDLRLYSHLVEQFSSRQLSVQSDAEKAFAATLSLLSRTFPGGFIFGLPAFSFDFGLSWCPVGDLKNFKRRDGFPSWSWLGWKGAPIRFNTHYADCKPSKALTTLHPVIRWTIQDAVSLKRHDIENEHHFFRGMDDDTRGRRGTKAPAKGFRSVLKSWKSTLKGSALHSEIALAPGWTSYVLDGHSHVNKPQRRGYTHSACPGQTFAHPLPIAKAPLTSVLQQWSPHLRFRTQAGILRLKTKFKNKVMELLLLDTLAGEWAGILEHSAHLDEVTPGVFPMLCEMIVIAEGVCHRTLEPYEAVAEMSVFEHLAFVDPYEFYLVLWIEWQDGIAYRKGIGRVCKRTWNKQGFKEKDIVLG